MNRCITKKSWHFCPLSRAPQSSSTLARSGSSSLSSSLGVLWPLISTCGHISPTIWVMSDGSDGKDSTGELGSILRLGEGLPTPVLLPGEFHEQRSLVGYSPWGCKESDVTGRLNNSNNRWMPCWTYFFLPFHVARQNEKVTADCPYTEISSSCFWRIYLH